MPDDVLLPIKPEQARAQAAEFFNVLPGIEFDLGGESWWLPNPRFLPPDMKKRFSEHLRFLNKDLDKVTVTDPITGKRRHDIDWPMAYKGALIDEDELLCIALMGTDAKADRDAYFKDGTLPETYARFRKAEGVPGQVQVHWQMMNAQMTERVSRDSKSR